MEKEGKRIKRWRGGMDAVQTAQYLHDMAAEGWILDEVGYLTYIFREEEPRELTYRVVTLKEAATGEELAAYEAKGWKKAGNWEEQYIFVKERDLWNEDAMERQMMVEEIDRRLEREKADRTANGVLGLILFAFFGVILFLQYGKDLFTDRLGMNLLVNFGPNLFFILFGGWLVSHRLKKKKERMLEGETVSARDADWRGSRIRTMAAFVVVFFLIGFAIYLEADWNQKKYDLPMEISYEDIPAVRLENLETAELERIGESISSVKELEGLHLGMDLYEQSEYQRLRWMSNFDNYVVEHRHLLIAEQVETDQRMKYAARDTEVMLDTEYYHFILEFLAEKQYQEDLEWEETFYSDHKNWGRDLLAAYESTFDALHVCRRDFGMESDIHILCRQGRQVMELNYIGAVEPQRILEEVAEVFAAQN